MKVFILIGCVDFEGGAFIGAFSSVDEAEDAKKECRAKGSIFDDFEIVEAELGKYKTR